MKQQAQLSLSRPARWIASIRGPLSPCFTLYKPMMEDGYFKRNMDATLLAWAESDGRKPLFLRGARQVGKTSAVRALGRRFKHCVEINFDSDAEAGDLFTENIDPVRLCEHLSLYAGTPIVPGETLLFLDEIQSCVPAMKTLRYFFEKHSGQHIIAAGSLLELALEEMPSFGVGRLHSVFMYPFSFHEFLEALGEGMLADACRNASPEKPLLQPFHTRLIERLKIFMLIGGMPESVASYAKVLLVVNKMLTKIRKLSIITYEIIRTY